MTKIKNEIDLILAKYKKKCLSCKWCEVENHLEFNKATLYCTDGLSFKCGEYVNENDTCYRYSNSFGQNWKIREILKEIVK